MTAQGAMTSNPDMASLWATLLKPDTPPLDEGGGLTTESVRTVLLERRVWRSNQGSGVNVSLADQS